ncbi:hypothetical protein [Oligoflexus tunisiensis]|uniref:hypothetical protein n=1 Tax=Oligoflexus tunisiensis TaxID=708132 RepID=UPI00114CC43C|nr:hypothetical protein [Oligoflexus tunisiensis]
MLSVRSSLLLLSLVTIPVSKANGSPSCPTATKSGSTCLKTSLIRQDETLLFGFELEKEKSGKRLALARSANPTAYTYRFGQAHRVELEFPKDRKVSGTQFQWSADSQHLSSLSFRNGNFFYTIYEELDVNRKPKQVGIRVKDLRSGTESDLKGSVLTREGSLAALAEDPGISKFARAPPLQKTKKTFCRVAEKKIEGSNKYEINVLAIHTETITGGLPIPVMQQLNQEVNRSFEAYKASDAADYKDEKDTIVTTQDCTNLSYEEISRLPAHAALSDRVSETIQGFSWDRLGTRIVTLLDSSYSDTGARPSGGSSNAKFYRVTDGQEIKRDRLFTPSGLAVMNNAVRKSFNCQTRPSRKDPDWEDPIVHCNRFSSVVTQGYFSTNENGRIEIAFSDHEIAPHVSWDPYAKGSFEPREFDTFLQ